MGRLYSVTKSVLSLAWGIADAEGRVPPLDQPVFRGLTVRQLLRMDSGLGFDEGFGTLNRQVLTYLHPDARKAARRARLKDPVAEDFHYNDFHSLLLGVLLEEGLAASGWRPSGTVAEPVAAWIWERLLTPLGLEHPGRFVVDSPRRRFPKTESGLCLAADDLARIGLLVLNQGEWECRTIVPRRWLTDSTGPGTGWTGEAAFHRYRNLAWGPWLSTGRGYYGWHWWGRHETGEKNTIFAMGIHGQILLVSPRHRAVAVRLADRWGFDSWWPEVMLKGLDAGEL
jgi:CubicO group peptidase (beta-lactamase class C family)